MVVGGLQDFSVSPSPLLGLFGLELGWTGLGLGLGGFGTKGLGTIAVFGIWGLRGWGLGLDNNELFVNNLLKMSQCVCRL